MSSEAQRTLESLKDLHGVVGSFIVSSTGNVVVQDLPSYFGSAAYDVGPRALRLRDALASSKPDFEAVVLRYSGHKLSVRPIGDSLLSILATADVNLPALRMASNLVARKLEKLGRGFDGEQHRPPAPTARPPAVRAQQSFVDSPRPPGVQLDTYRDRTPTAPAVSNSFALPHAGGAPSGSGPSAPHGAHPVHHQAAPEAHARAPGAKRPVYFRGKRVL